MVTRVARAMFKHHHQGSLETPYWLDMARAAIAAMELPTEEMVRVNAHTYADKYAHAGQFGPTRDAFTSGANFVRAALKEEKP